MINIDAYVGQAMGIPFLATTGLTTFPSLQLLTDDNSVTPYTIKSLGVVGLSAPAEISLGAGIYNVTFTAASTGQYYILYGGVILAHIKVESQDKLSVLKNIEDEALGSWSWNKTTGVLSLLKQTGLPLATYNVVDTTTLSSRNRTA